MGSALTATLAPHAALEQLCEVAGHIAAEPKAWPAEQAVSLEMAAGRACDAAEAGAEAVQLAVSALLLARTARSSGVTQPPRS